MLLLTLRIAILSRVRAISCRVSKTQFGCKVNVHELVPPKARAQFRAHANTDGLILPDDRNEYLV